MTKRHTQCMPSHTKFNNHCRCLHCIYVYGRHPLGVMQVARQQFQLQVTCTGISHRCSLVLRLRITAPFLKAVSKQGHRKGCLLQLNRRKCVERERSVTNTYHLGCFAWTDESYMDDVTMATTHFKSKLPLACGYHGNGRVYVCTHGPFEGVILLLLHPHMLTQHTS